jgi:hypothetical protein
VKHYRTEKLGNARKSGRGRQHDPAEADNWEPTVDDEWEPEDGGDIIEYKSYVEKIIIQSRNIVG